jgi:hypothetical protein
MANVYGDTVLLEARAFLNSDQNKKFELRKTKNMVVDAFLRNRDFTVPNLAAIKEATTQTTAFEYMKTLAFTVNSAKSNTPSGEKSGSGKTSLSWATKTFVIDLPTKQYHGNDVSRAMGFAYSLWNGEKTFWNTMATTLLAYLNTNKTTVNAGDGYDGALSAGTMSIDNANADQFYGIVDGHMYLNNFTGPYIDIYSSYWQKYVRHYQAQGSGNDENLSYQFGNFLFHPSNSLSPASGQLAKHYIIPEGGVVMLDWNEKANREGQKMAAVELTTIPSLFFPGITFDVMIKESLGDTSSDGGTVQDITLTYEFALNYALATQPFTTSGQTAIHEYVITSA